MALSTENKLYISLGLLVALGGALFLVNKKDKEEAASYTLSGQAAKLPKLEISEDQTKKIDKITLSKPAGDAGAAVDVELVKSGEDWKLQKPIEASANQANVKSLLDNLKALKVSEAIDTSTKSYEKFGVSDDKALHAVFYEGTKPVLDAYFGESGGRGQMTRLNGNDGVYAVKGYSSYLYAREPKGWRDMSIFKFEASQVVAANIANEHGSFDFTRTKDGDPWTAKFTPKPGSTDKLKDFDESKVNDFIRPYASLNADNYAEKDKTEADLGLDKPVATLLFTLKDGAKRELKVGATATSNGRWVKASDNPQIWSISSWAADWATAEPKKFEKPEKKEDKTAKKD